MTRAINPKCVPPVPDGYTGWGRSTKRAGATFHLHRVGVSACLSVILDRSKCDETIDSGKAAYWGVCARCYRLALKLTAPIETEQLA